MNDLLFSEKQMDKICDYYFINMQISKNQLKSKTVTILTFQKNSSEMKDN